MNGGYRVCAGAASPRRRSHSKVVHRPFFMDTGEDHRALTSLDRGLLLPRALEAIAVERDWELTLYTKSACPAPMVEKTSDQLAGCDEFREEDRGAAARPGRGRHQREQHP